MKNIIIILLCTVAISLIFLGKVQYDNKIAQAGKVTSQDQPMEVEDNNLLDLTRNMDDELKNSIKKKMDSEETIKLLIVGSDAIMNSDSNNSPWPLQVKNALEENYGVHTFDIEIMNFEKITTNHLIETKGHDEIAAVSPDVLIIEPLLLNDNGFVKMEDTLGNLEMIIDSVKKINNEAYVIIQPPNPIYEPETYMEQVNALEEYAMQNNIEYFNHWEVWPDTSSENIKSFLQGTFPNAKGQSIWADFIIEYFIAE
ncbi:SGNH/GDSL hydrolase family protein [Sutcliffiella horikoshii]|uniref:SGNH/GDSL hydrolase family protein n=1 Tax=Sutcliffiella horikoshii TaxID=79883 RepID=UPI001CBC268D|nr:SGNH/GDSL hydrolase family protein [Sutcliffiella horikoshii]UAL47041.1 SGNH/GDSL hydrolase family protein [Sutcliffiella horikoshii]